MSRQSSAAAIIAGIPIGLLTCATLAAQSGSARDSTRHAPKPSGTPAAVATLTTPPDSAGSGGAAAHTPPPPTPEAPNHLETALPGVRIGGYAEASYVYSNNANGRDVSGRLYDRFQGQFTVNALKVSLDHAYAADRWDAGFHADLLVGQNATMLQSNGLSLGNEGDVTQLFVTLNIPTSDRYGVQIRVGKMATLMGLEVIEDPANPNWSEGNLFDFVENFTEVGLSVEHRFNRLIDAQLRLINGWDVARDNNTASSFMGRVGFAPDSSSSVGIVAYYGPEQANSWAERYGAEVLLNRKLVPTVGAWLQVDYGHEAALVPPASSTGTMSAASWWGASGWLAIGLDATLDLALRADYVDDEDGVRSNGFLYPAFSPVPGMRHAFASGTATLDIKRWSDVLVRPELRYDHSNRRVFAGHRSQVSVAFAVAYLY